jgi:hypothetical protein
MLQKVSEEIAYCHRRASECRAKAEASVNDASRQEYFDLENRWLTLARSYELSERLTDFTREFERRRRHRSADPLVWQPIITAPFDGDLELAVIDAGGPHALVFPCRRVLRGWIKAGTMQPIDVRPTHWRPWTQTAGS